MKEKGITLCVCSVEKGVLLFEVLCEEREGGEIQIWYGVLRTTLKNIIP